MVKCCDVCEEIIEQPVCPHCRFNNDYQFYDEGSTDYAMFCEIMAYITVNHGACVDEILDEFDMSIGELRRLFQEYAE